MADNVILNSGSGGALIATDDVAGIQHQYVKVEYGDDGVATPVSISYPLPTTFSGLSIGVTGIPFVTGNINVFSMPSNIIVSGNITGINNTVSIALPNGCSTIGLQLSNSWIGQLEFEGSVDNTNYNTIYSSNGINTINATAGNGIFILPGAGYVSTRVRASTWTSGTSNVVFMASIGGAATILTGPLPGGTNNIGDVDIASIAAGSTVGITGIPTIIASYPVGVTGTFWPTSQTVTGTVNIATTNVGITGVQTVLISYPAGVTGTFWQNTQHITGTVNIGTITAGTSVGITGTTIIGGTITMNAGTGTLHTTGTMNIANIAAGTTVGVSGAVWVTGNLIGSTVGITGTPTVWVSYPVGVTGTFWQNTQHVTGTVNIATMDVGITGTPTVWVSYPVGVTGTFWQSTQTVTGTINIATTNVGLTGTPTVNISSITAGVTVGVTGQKVGITGTLTDNISYITPGVTIGVTGANIGITGQPTVYVSYPVGVTGTFWPTSQTITGTVNISTTNVGITGVQTIVGNVGLTGTQTVLASYPVGVTGTFWQTIQSITGTVNIATTQVGITGIQTVLTSYPVGITGNVGLTGIPAVSISNIVAGTNLIGDVGIAPRTVGGLSYISMISSGGGVNLTEVKASAGQLYSMYTTNTNAGVRYLKVFDALTGVITVGTTIPQLRLSIPGNAAGAGFYVDWIQGVVFNTGIAFAMTTGVADTDAGAVAPNEIIVNAFYK